MPALFSLISLSLIISAPHGQSLTPATLFSIPPPQGEYAWVSQSSLNLSGTQDYPELAELIDTQWHTPLETDLWFTGKRKSYIDVYNEVRYVVTTVQEVVDVESIQSALVYSQFDYESPHFHDRYGTILYSPTRSRQIHGEELFTDPDAVEQIFARTVRTSLLQQYAQRDLRVQFETPDRFFDGVTIERDDEFSEYIDEWLRNEPDLVNRISLQPTSDLQTPGVSISIAHEEIGPFVLGTYRIDIPTQAFRKYLKPNVAGAFR